MGRRLYVGNLPYTTGEAELQELFSKAGTVTPGTQDNCIGCRKRLDAPGAGAPV